ncbi:hypothetical protein BPO_1492 [Bergeyella porcorum]|uniref:Uncharacterized protein n=1 Tax=Bergeyella porcorum TaxID=1735111 RepID=A0AAU0F3U1_9FLAO
MILQSIAVYEDDLKPILLRIRSGTESQLYGEPRAGEVLPIRIPTRASFLRGRFTTQYRVYLPKRTLSCGFQA